MTGEDPVRLNSAGMTALAQGRAAEAVTLLRRAAAADPKAAVLWYNLANAAMAAEDEATAGEALDTALDLEPFMAHALLAKGQLLERQGSDGAIPFYQRLVAAVNPNEKVGPGFAAGLAHARAVLERHGAEMAGALDAALAPHLAAADPESAGRFGHALDVALGRRRVHVHQPLVLHYPYLPAEQFFARRHFPWLDRLEAATDDIRAELQALLAAGGDGFAPYVAYPRGAPVNQWATLNHSDAWAARFLIKHGAGDEAMRTLCPRTAALLDTLPLFDLPNRGPVAFFSLLKPGTHIPPHTGATNIRSIIHLPLVVPQGCTFRVGNETRAWVEGEAFAFDDTIEHEAINPSGELRAILIIDAWNPHLSAGERDLLRAYISALDARGRGIAEFGAN